MKKSKSLKNFYDNVYRKGEEKHFTNFVTTGSPSSETTETIKEINWKNKSVLDVGCGTGYFSFHAAKKGATVLGIDFSKEAIKIAKQKYSHKNLNFKQMNATKELSGHYDVIVSLGTLEHTPKPFEILKNFKKHLKPNGKIIITSPNWVNPRGYILMTLFHLFDAPITLADLHYLTPIDFMNWAQKLDMTLKWRTIDKSWAHGNILLKDFKRRLPNVISDANLPVKKKQINELITWLENKVLPFNNSLPHSGATGLYVFKMKKS